jgi:tryptophan 2-C-methyltransferase
MVKPLVTLVNPNKVHPAITPYALDILTTFLEREDFDVEVLDLTFCRDQWQEAVAGYFDIRTPLLIGITIRNTDTIYAQDQRVFLGEHQEIIAEIRRHSQAPIVAGGAGFSSMPFAAASYLGIDYGVKGPGEVILCQLAKALARGETPAMPGLIVNHGSDKVERIQVSGTADGLLGLAGFREPRTWQVDKTANYQRRSGDPFKVDNAEYYRRGGLGNILTKNGCPFACAHCLEPDAKGNRFALRTAASVVDEMEMLAIQGVYDLHTADSEFNLGIASSKEVLREIVRRKEHDASSPLHQMRLWVYCQPAPFDDEFARLLAAAGCAGVDVACDHVRDDMLNGWKVTEKQTRYYGFDDVTAAVGLIRKHGMLCLVDVLLGMPGETLETLRDAIDRVMALDTTVVGFSLGIRVFPYSPLGIWSAAQSDGTRPVPGLQSNTATEPIILRQAHQCGSPLEYERQFMFETSGTIRPVFYFSPDLPEEPETIAQANGRWVNTLRFMWDYIPATEYPRIMLPTIPGVNESDNSYADNPFVTSLVKLGYKGAYWSRWRERDAIMREASRQGLCP